MALKAGRVGVHPDDVDLNGHIKNNADLSAYVKKTDAPGYNDILTQTSASSTYLTQSNASSTYQTQSGMSSYQPLLVSGTNIKTINGNSLLGSGDIEIGGGGTIDLSDYVKKVDAPGYADILTQTSASSTYQTISGMSSYQTVSGMSDYVAKADASGYDDILTTTDAALIYLTQSNASSTYQTQSGMSSYVLKSEASGYNDILTTANAALVYQPILSSGVNIKTVNGSSLLGSGNLETSVNCTLLWTNSAPTSNFAAQNVLINLSSYKMVLITFSGDRSSDTYNVPNARLYPVLSDDTTYMSEYGVSNRYRSFTISTSGINFDAGHQSGASGNANQNCVPLKIYGIS